MRASPQESTGTAGLSDVMGNFERIGWGPVPNAQHDLGTDLFLMARDVRRFDRGLVVGAQVKAGPTAFDTSVEDDSGNVVGWEYYEPDVDHFESWVSHGLPHLLVLNDLDTRISYWVHVTPEAVTSTGMGMKIVVPAEQTIDMDHLDALMEVAAKQKTPVPLEGTAWTAGIETIPPARRLRHAMLAPRLVAPHPNTGTAKELQPEEGLAVLARGSVSRFHDFAAQHASVPNLTEAAGHRDWRWRFVAAFGRYIQGEESGVAGVLDDAPNESAVAGARILQACEMFDWEDYDSALAVLTEQIESDKADPADQAWLLMQRARIFADIGAVADARRDAACVLRVGEQDDVTASALRGAAAWLIFQTAPWGDRSLGDMIASSDNAVSWWRSQAISSALTEAETRVFRRWADEQTRRFEAEDVVNNRLYAALLSTHLAGEHGAWRASGSLLARNTIMTAHSDNDGDRLQEGISELRRSGDAPNVALAAKRLWSVGPLPPLSRVAAAITDRSWSHTTAQANLRLWQHAGDLLPPDAAVAASRWCLDVLADPATFAARTHPSFLIGSGVLDAMPPLVLAGGQQCQRDVLAFVTGLPEVTDELTARGWAGVLFPLQPRDLDADERAQLREAADRNGNAELSAAMLALLVDDPEVLRILLDRAVEGDSAALAGISHVDRLDEAAATSVLEREAETLERIVADAHEGTHHMFARDPFHAFVVVATAFPERAPWQKLIRLLEHPGVATDHKRSGCMVLASLADELPEPVREELIRIVPAIGRTPPTDGLFGRPLAGADHYLAAALGALNDDDFAQTITSLLNGSRHDRADATRLIALNPHTPHAAVLVAMLSDPLGNVRAAAATALVKLATSSQRTESAVVAAGVERALRDPGASIPLGLARGLVGPDRELEHKGDIANALIAHPSARVRVRAQDALSDQLP